MQDIFPEFYRPSHEEVGRFIAKATIVADANVLLELYRLGTSEREQVFDVLDKAKDRLWLPYQAGKEYQQHRLQVVAEQAGAYEKARSLHGIRDPKDMAVKLQDMRLPHEVREEIESLLSPLASRLKRASAKYQSKIDELTHAHVVTVAQAISNDPVRNRLDVLYAGKVGKRPDSKLHEERVREGVRRSKERIPPGYMDADKKGDEHIAGDYLMWTQILDYAQDSDRAVLFVTKDQKEDWFERFGGQITGPRTELVVEFSEHSKNGYHQVTLGRFLDLANEFLSAKVEEATIQRVSAEPHLLVDAVGRGIDWSPSSAALEALRQAGSLSPSSAALEALRQAGSLSPSLAALEALKMQVLSQLVARDIVHSADTEDGKGSQTADAVADSDENSDPELDEPE